MTLEFQELFCNAVNNHQPTKPTVREKVGRYSETCSYQTDLIWIFILYDAVYNFYMLICSVSIQKVTFLFKTCPKIAMKCNGTIFQHQNFQIRKFNEQVMAMAYIVGNQVWLNCLDQQTRAVSKMNGITMTLLNGQRWKHIFANLYIILKSGVIVGQFTARKST